MKAYQLDRINSTFSLRDIAIPEPARDQVLLLVKAAGICHSDAHFVEGRMTEVLSDKPLTLGHEVAGVVVKLGPGVDTVKNGDRVAVCLLSHPVQQARWDTSIGLGYDGGYAEYALAYREHLIAIPEGVSFEQAATATDAIATAYHAVVEAANVQNGSTVAVIGLGGLGMNALAIAALRGAKVYGIDTNTSKYEEASQQGASACAQSLKAFKSIVFDSVIDFVGVSATAKAAVMSVKKSGSVVLVGLGAREITLPTEIIVTRNIIIKGSIGSSMNDVRQVLNLIARGDLNPKLVEISFDHVAEALRKLGKQEVEGRLFTRPDRSSKI